MRIGTAFAAVLVGFGIGAAAFGQQPVANGTAPGAPAVAVAAESGDFVIVWNDVDGVERNGFSSMGVFARLFEASGKPKGPAFRVHQETSGDQALPKVALDERENFVVVWQGGTWTRGTNSWPGGDGDGMGVFVQRFDRNGRRLGDPLRASRSAAGSQVHPNVAVRPDGSFLVVWEDCPRFNQFNQDCPNLRVGSFSAGGERQGGELEIPVLRNVGLGGPTPIPTPHIVVEPGGFAVGWTEFEACYKWFQEAFPVILHFTDSGQPVGERFRLDDGDCEDATGWHLRALVADREGSSAAFFRGLRDSFQLFDPAGRPVGRRKVIRRARVDEQITTAAMAADGRFAVIWDAHAATGDPQSPDRFLLLASFFSPQGEPLGKRIEVASSPWFLHTPPAVAFGKNGTLIVVWAQDFSSNGGASFTHRLLFRQVRRN
jgi:hypothetical protein